MDTHFFLSTCTPEGWASLGEPLRREDCRREVCLLLAGPGCDGGGLLQQAAALALQRGLSCEQLLSPVPPYLPEAVLLPERELLAAVGAPFGGSVPPMPGPFERYVNLTDCYDRTGLRELLPQTELCRQEEARCTRRAAHGLSAAAQLLQDMRATLLTPAVLAHLEKRARGILTRELPRRSSSAGQPFYRYLSAFTAQGQAALFPTVSALCSRVWVLADSYRLAHHMLALLAEGACAAGYDVIACPSPLEPDRLEHLLIPQRELAFVTSSPALPWPGAWQRRVRLDAMVEADLLRRHRGWLRFSRRVISSLLEDSATALTEAAQLHLAAEELYSAFVDQQMLARLQRETAESLLQVWE